MEGLAPIRDPQVHETGAPCKRCGSDCQDLKFVDRCRAMIAKICLLVPAAEKPGTVAASGPRARAHVTAKPLFIGPPKNYQKILFKYSK